MDTLLPLATKVGEKLKARKETIAISESSSGGLLSAALLAVPGASAYFMGGAVVYTGPAGIAFLDATKEKRGDIRSSSEPWATLAAELVRGRLRTTWGLAETGAAGPTGNRYGDAAGHTCVAVVGPTKAPGGKIARTLETASSDRVANMRAFALEALKLIDEQLS
jgi:PncC family amidohydrolase